MHAAAFNDQVECLQLLLSRGGNVDSVDQSGRTPLIMAADNGHAGAVGELPIQCVLLSCRFNLFIFISTQNSSSTLNLLSHKTLSSIKTQLRVLKICNYNAIVCF